MVSSVSSNVSNAWAIRENRNEDQTKDKVETPLFGEGTEGTGGTNGSTGTGGTNGTGGTGTATPPGTLTEVNEQIATAEGIKEELEAKLKEAQETLKTLQGEVAELQAQVSSKINDAIKAANKYSEEQQEEIKSITDRILNDYYSGKISKEEMQSKLSSELGAIDPELPSSVTSILNSVDSIINLITLKMGQICDLQTQIKSFQDKICLANEKLACLGEQKKKLEEEQKKTDPIGFADDKGNTFDFIIDRNDDGKFNNEQEFLGAQNNWNEMIALDENKDGIVSADEMEKSNVQVLMTDATGKQSIVNVKDLGIESIDLSTYQEGHEQLGEGNEVLGVFGITINGKTTNDGYNTLDTVDWLDKHYSNMFTDKAEGKGRFAGNEGVPDKQPGKYNYAGAFSDVLAMRKSMTEANNIFLANVKETKDALEAANNTVVDETEEDKDKDKDKV